jgi:hypothetical protein
MSRFLPAYSMYSVLLLVALLAPAESKKHEAPAAADWTFAVSGDSRNCGDFVVPVIAARVRAEGDAFYWHLGDFRWMSQPDEDLVSMQPAGTTLAKNEYQKLAWDDFLTHQMATFGDLPVFLGRGNHETVAPMTRSSYIAKFGAFLNRPEIAAQDEKDGASASPKGSPWFHFVRGGVDFITLDNASQAEFSDAQLAWLRGVLDRDLAAGSGVTTILAGMHEALPHSTSSNHAMDDWPLGIETGQKVYGWFAEAQKSGKHVYLLASHSHFYSPAIYDTPYWRQAGTIIPGIIIGSAGAHRYKLPPEAAPGSKTHVYGYLRATVHRDGTIAFDLQEIGESEMVAHRWPNAPLEAIHECFVHNSD